MKYIAVTVALRNVFSKSDLVLDKLRDIASNYVGEEVCLIHGFMLEVEIKTYLVNNHYYQYLLDLTTELKKLFPNQMGMLNILDKDTQFNLTAMREKMAAKVAETNATVYVIGSVIDGACEEAWLYEKQRANIKYIEL